MLTIVLAWIGSQLSPAWANRYLAAGVAPFLLLAAAGFAHAGRLGLVGLALVAVLWAIDGAPEEKSNVRDGRGAIAPSLRPGDLVVATQPEQVSVLDYYLPDGLRYATLTGPVADTGVTDWRDGVERLRATSRRARPRAAARRARARPAARARRADRSTRVGRWSAPWTELVRLRSEEWLQYVSNDPRFGLTAIEPADAVPVEPEPGPGAGLPQALTRSRSPRGVSAGERAVRSVSAKRVPSRAVGVDVELAAHAPGQLAPDREAEAEAARRAGARCRGGSARRCGRAPPPGCPAPGRRP